MNLSSKQFLIIASVLFLNACSGGSSGQVPSSTPATGQVVTFAGSSTKGFANGVGTSAKFSFMNGIVADASGNIYVSDTQNNVIRIITPEGTVSTFAGTGASGNSNGDFNVASFSAPAGLAIDAQGNIYVADGGNNLIRKISRNGLVTTVAGNGTNGSTNGPSSSSSFNYPLGVAIDLSGNIYVADDGNNMIRKITSTGQVSTFAGSLTAGYADGTGSAASFSVPAGVAVDAAGNVYVADRMDNLIRKITPAGSVTTLAGNSQFGNLNGTGSAASFNQPNGVALDSSGNVYVADVGNGLIRMISPSGVVTTLAGNSSGTQASVDGPLLSASFTLPGSITLDHAGNIYVTDATMVRKITP